MVSSRPRGNEGGVLSEAGFTGWGGFSGWVGLWMEVVVRIEILGIFGFRTIERLANRMAAVHSGWSVCYTLTARI